MERVYSSMMARCSISIAAEDLSFCNPAEEADQPEFANLKRAFAETLAGPCPRTVDLNLSCTSTPATHQWRGLD